MMTWNQCMIFHLPSKSSNLHYLSPGRVAEASAGSLIQLLRIATPPLRTSSLVCLIVFCEQSFPRGWLTSIIIPFLKPRKDLQYSENYRPISLTNCLCKILEKMVNTRFMWFLEWKMAFPPSSLVSGHAAQPLTISCSLNKMSTMLSHGSTTQLPFFLTSRRPMIQPERKLAHLRTELPL